MCGLRLLLFGGVILLATTPVSRADPFDVTFAEQPSRAIIVVVDGLSYQVWDRMELPVMNRMMATGAHVAKLYVPTTAHPKTGEYARLHTSSIPNVVMMSGTIFVTRDTQYLQECFFPELPTAFIANITAYQSLNTAYHFSYQKDGEDEVAIKMALQCMEQVRPVFMRIHMQKSGTAGMQNMLADQKEPWRWDIWHERSPYRRAMTQADRLIGDLLSGLEALDVLEETVLIVLGDHGQHDTGWHPPEFVDSAITTAILWGAGVYEGARLSYGEMIDVAPTVCSLMQVHPPKNSIGMVWAEALKGQSGSTASRRQLMWEILKQNVRYSRQMAHALGRVESLDSGAQGLLFRRLNRDVRECFYSVERFAEWPQAGSMETLTERNAVALQSLNQIIQDMKTYESCLEIQSGK